jgi:hypothetical protein
MSLSLITPRALQPVTLAEAKLQARIDATDEDALVTSMIIVATDECEAIMQRAILPQTWQRTLDAFFDANVYQDPIPITVDLIRGTSYTTGAAAIGLQRPKVTSITSVKYIDINGTLQTLGGGLYQLAAASDYTARVFPAFGTVWPSTRAVPEAVQIQFVCGYPDANSVPEGIKQWVKCRVKDLYDNRGAWTAGVKVEINPFVDFLLDRYLAKTF